MGNGEKTFENNIISNNNNKKEEKKRKGKKKSEMRCGMCTSGNTLRSGASVCSMASDTAFGYVCVCLAWFGSDQEKLSNSTKHESLGWLKCSSKYEAQCHSTNERTTETNKWVQANIID